MRVNENCLARQLKEHWLNSEPVSVDINAVLEFIVALTKETYQSGCEVTLSYTGENEQPYDDVESLRCDYQSGVVAYRCAQHPLGQHYDMYRALHDLRHHCQLGYCFGLPGEIASAYKAIELVNSLDGLAYGPALCKPEDIINLIMSDVAAPNAAYYVDNGWGDYDYTKIVSWPPHLIAQVIELGRHYASSFS